MILEEFNTKCKCVSSTVILEPVDFVRVARSPQFGGFPAFGASGSQAGANAQTQTTNQGGFGGFGGFGANAANAGANTNTFSNVRSLVNQLENVF